MNEDRKLVELAQQGHFSGHFRWEPSGAGLNSMSYMAPDSDMRRMIRAAGITDATVHQVPEWAHAVIVCIGGADDRRVAVLRACQADPELRAAVFAALCAGEFYIAAELAGV